MSVLKQPCHCRRNIKQQLRDRHFPDAAIKSVLEDIFGVQQDEIFAEGFLAGGVQQSKFAPAYYSLHKEKLAFFLS